MQSFSASVRDGLGRILLYPNGSTYATMSGDIDGLRCGVPPC